LNYNNERKTAHECANGSQKYSRVSGKGALPAEPFEHRAGGKPGTSDACRPHPDGRPNHVTGFRAYPGGRSTGVLESNEQNEEANRTSGKPGQKEVLTSVAGENKQNARVSDTCCCDKNKFEDESLCVLDVAAHDRLSRRGPILSARLHTIYTVAVLAASKPTASQVLLISMGRP